MANKYDLNIVMTQLAAGASEVCSIGGAIAAGKTRFLTYLRIERAALTETTGITGTTAVIVDTANSAAALAYEDISSPQMSLILPSMSNSSSASGTDYPPVCRENSIPTKPNMNHPICAVTGGASAFMVLGVQSGPAVRIFAQYYDE